MSKALSANIHDPNHTVDEYDIYFNGDILSGNEEHEFSANVHDPNHTVDEYDIYFNGELIESGGGGGGGEGWTDGVPYTDIEVIKNKYIGAGGEFIQYSGWDIAGFIPCNGAGTIHISRLPGGEYSDYNAFYNENHEYIKSFSIKRGDGYEIVTVPDNAYYFALSYTATAVAYWVDGGIIPYA